MKKYADRSIELPAVVWFIIVPLITFTILTYYALRGTCLRLTPSQTTSRSWVWYLYLGNDYPTRCCAICTVSILPLWRTPFLDFSFQSFKGGEKVYHLSRTPTNSWIKS